MKPNLTRFLLENITISTILATALSEGECFRLLDSGYPRYVCSYTRESGQTSRGCATNVKLVNFNSWPNVQHGVKTDLLSTPIQTVTCHMQRKLRETRELHTHLQSTKPFLQLL